jgi:hypothetical protein
LAVAHAAKRRFLPIVITSTTTIAGLYSLAVGLGGHSLMWAPVATAIVWGLAFSTVLTLLLVPVIYLMAVRPGRTDLAEPGPVSLPLPLSGARSISGWLKLLVSPRARRTQRALEQALRDDESRALFQEGLQALAGDDLETPIRCFERLVSAEPDSLELILLAAQANLRLMQVRGWDIGYAARARRYLTRARSLAPSDGRVGGLSAVLEDIEGTQEPD